MGKKPVIGLIGAAWAGIALVGCDCCHNSNNKFNTPATFAPARSTAGNTPAPTTGTPASASVATVRGPESTTTGFSNVSGGSVPLNGSGAAKPADSFGASPPGPGATAGPVLGGSPTVQNTLRP